MFSVLRNKLHDQNGYVPDQSNTKAQIMSTKSTFIVLGTAYISSDTLCECLSGHLTGVCMIKQ